MIIKELFTNLAILTSLIFLYTQITNTSLLQQTSLLTKKVLLGISGGLLSNILMLYSIHFGSTFVDLRHIPIILVAHYGGVLPATLSMALVIIGRFLFGVNTSSYLAVILAVSVTFISILIARWKVTNKLKVFYSLTFANFIFTILVSYLIQDFNTIMLIIPTYWVISYMAGYLSFYVVQYLRNSQRLFERYKTESATDGLTGLNNVRKFDELFNNLLKELDSKNEMLSLLYMDIDHFKRINDTYGHKEGDVVLIELGKILKDTVRSFDIVSRNGGEEFTVILLDCPTKRAIQIGERIRNSVQNHTFILTTGEQIHITISIGIACYNETTDTPSSLIEDADQALYQAKRAGRNRVCVAEQKA
ncbi:diguanylate cyclase [Bacillus sp. BGMRC 2118]|nr:diguanylate cyclase [Bacillus sp. BGMRC 2118]